MSHRPEPPAATAPVIDADSMQADLEWLAGDDLRGRLSFDRESTARTAEFLASRFAEAGLRPIGSRFLWDFTVPHGPVVAIADHLLWVERDGVGAAAPDERYAAIAFASVQPGLGQAVFVGRRAPADRIDRRIAVMLAEPRPGEAWTVDDLRERLLAVDERGAIGAVVVGGPSESMPSPTELQRALGEVDLATVFVHHDVARTWSVGGRSLEAAAAATPEIEPIRAVPLEGTRMSITQSVRRGSPRVPNVLASVPGSDLADEIVIVGAHYDHVGTRLDGLTCRSGPEQERDEICNGADDNASGTSMVLAVARALARAHHRPRRTIVFAQFGAEEIGLFGSRALADAPPDAPPFAGGRVVAMVNLDMVGRLDGKPLQIAGATTSPTWRPLVERLRPTELAVRYSDEEAMRSDLASFWRSGIPVLGFFTGTHDDYHRTSDEADAIDHVGMHGIANLVLDVVVELGRGAPVERVDPAASDAERPESE